MFLIFSHTITQYQIKDAKNSLGIETFVYLPQELQKLWSNIPPDISDIGKFLEPIKNYLKQNLQPNDYVLVQGDFGATCKIASFVKTLNAKPIYATTIRDAQEKIIDGKVVKTSTFKHIMFRSF
jgi:hypothetical protein